jgi:hypothetical protein
MSDCQKFCLSHSGMEIRPKAARCVARRTRKKEESPMFCLALPCLARGTREWVGGLCFAYRDTENVTDG